MKMNRYYTLWAIALVASLAGVSCQHEPGAEVPTGEQGPVFIAKLGQPTRSHFKDEDEGTEKAGTLYWDATDRVAIISAFQMDEASDFSDHINEYCEELSEGVLPESAGDYHTAYERVGYLNSYIGKPAEKYLIASTAMVDIQEDPTEAILRPKRTGARWFANANEAVGDPLYEFLAVYPIREENEDLDLTLLYWEDDMACVAYPMTVPHEQDGVSYGSYHICIDSGLNESASNFGLHFMSDVLSRKETIRFTRLNPVTSLLRFRMRIGSDTPVNVAKMVFTLEDDTDVISGASWVSAWGESCWIVPDRWTEGNNFSDVVINFTTPVTVSTTPTDPYYAVILPSFKDDRHYWGPVAANHYDAVDIRIEAYDTSDNLLYTVTKACPANGFVPGGRYDITLSLDGSTPEEHFDLTVNAGSYRDGGDPFIQE